MKFTVTLDRVFDLHRRGGGRYPTTTQLSFESGGQVHYSVSVPGLPTIEAGMTVTAILAEPGNWQSLKGWRNWTTGELALPAMGQTLIFACCALVVALLFAPTKQSDYFGFAAAFSGFLTVIAVVLFVQWWRQRTVVRALKEMNVHPSAHAD
jgi:ABC-type Fe3+-siderophore transport system permease subunit